MSGKFGKLGKDFPKDFKSDSFTGFMISSSSTKSDNIPAHELVHRRGHKSKEPLEDPFYLEPSMDIEGSSTEGEIKVENQVEEEQDNPEVEPILDVVPHQCCLQLSSSSCLWSSSIIF